MSSDYDYLKDPCPGCGQDIDCTLHFCPHCRYDLDKGAPAAEDKPKKKTEKKVEPQTPFRLGRETVWVPALGRMSGKSLDFPALHWPSNTEVNDENLREWAYNLRDAWCMPLPEGGGENTLLSNHAIGYLASHADGKRDDPLRENASRIVALLGGDDWR